MSKLAVGLGIVYLLMHWPDTVEGGIKQLGIIAGLLFLAMVVRSGVEARPYGDLQFPKGRTASRA